ncbi:MAG: HEPN domain-containing protein [Phycisphaerae bacterium]|nr:HEPN domain-containing protein [Phycisphaerae bacterium]
MKFIKKTLSHLPKDKRDELKLITEKIRELVPQAKMIFLFGSYARGDWKDGPHKQGRGKLTVHKTSDYDICVITRFEITSRNIRLWDEVKTELATMDLSTIVRIIPRDLDFVNFKLRLGQYFFTEICEQGIMLYDSGEVELNDRKPLDMAEEKRIAQSVLDEIFHKAKGFYKAVGWHMDDSEYSLAAFNLHQATEHSYKAVLLMFGGECPQEHHLDILGNLASDYCPELKGLIPRKTDEQQKLFELLDYAYIGARYDFGYEITKKQLEKLAPCVKKLHEVTERICKEKIELFV